MRVISTAEEHYPPYFEVSGPYRSGSIAEDRQMSFEVIHACPLPGADPEEDLLSWLL